MKECKQDPQEGIRYITKGFKMAEKELPVGSSIKKSRFSNFMGKLFGWTRSEDSKNITLTQVDLGSRERIGQGLLGDVVSLPKNMSEKLDRLLNLWLNDNTDKYQELAERKSRVDQLAYAVLNDPYIGRTVQLYADEACQLDEQDTIINIETPDPRMTRDMYKLLNMWGITQPRIRTTIENLATYGDAFWANKVSEKGVERIIPLKQLQISDRLEFNPIQVLEKEKRRTGAFANFANNNYLIQQMLDEMENNGDFAEMFDTKLFGFAIDNDLVVPPWSVTHFRIGAEQGQFYPFGTSPIIGALAPFKQTASTIALQSLARIMSFPITLYKVKTSDAMDPVTQLEVVNNVRQEYDNIGVSPKAGASEVYSVNTKIWMPDGLMDVEVKESKVDIGFVDDIKLYEDRTAVAVGLPKSFFSEEFYGLGNSGKSLIQQYKPFARKVYSIQSAFLESLSNLFRIHFAITGIYDFRTPFTLSMKFPAVEVTTERNQSRRDSIDIANDVIDLIKSSCGLSDEESLPPDIVRDILDKYTFLDAADIMKWTRDAKFNSTFNVKNSKDDGGSFSLDSGGSDFDDDFDMADDTSSEADNSNSESLDFGGEGGITEAKEKKVLEKYNSIKEKIYFESLNNLSVDSFVRNGRHIHFSNQISDSLDLMLETLSKGKNPDRLRESFKTKFDDFRERN